MNARNWSLATALVLVTDGALSTDYTKERAVRVACESELRMESSSKMERDGQPMEFTSSSTQKREIVHVDKVLAHEDGVPSKVQRSYLELKHEGTATFGDQERSDDREGSLVGVTLELTREGDEVAVKVVEGSDPGGNALEGHRLELALDALLPDGDKKAGESWEVDNDAVRRALGLDLAAALFPPPEPEAGGGERGRGRSRGPGMSSMLFQFAEWECKATLKEEDEDFEGSACAAIELEFEGSGSVPEQEGGPGGGRSVRSLGFVAGLPRIENSFEIKIEGTLLFDRASRMPVHLELEGTLESESHTERTWNDQTMKIDSESSGEFVYEVTLSIEKSE